MKTFSDALIDSNVLVYAIDKLSKHQNQARQVVVDAMNGKFRAYLATQNIIEFLSVVTNKHRVTNAISHQVAWREINKCLSCDSVNLIFPNNSTIDFFSAFLKHWKKGKPNHVFDLHLAAIMLSQGFNTVITANVQDFQSIPGLQVIDLAQYRKS